MTIDSMAAGSLGMRMVVAGHVASGALPAPEPSAASAGTPSLDPAVGQLLDALA